MKKILLLAIIIFTISCNNKKEEIRTLKEPLENEGFKEEILHFKVTLKTNHNDKFRLLLNKIKKGDSKINIHVAEELKNDNNFNVIEAKIKEDFFPQEIIIDLGKKTEKIVDIKDIYLKFSGTELIIPKHKIDHFFYPNKFVKHDSLTKNYEAYNKNKNHFLIFRNRIIDSLWMND